MPKTQVSCPQCRQPILADVQQLFDVGDQLQDKQVFLSGAFNLANCPSCGYQGRLSMPLVYHDPDKEILFTYFPPEIGATLDAQQKSIGPFINRIVDRLPQEKRKGYLFNPKTMLTLQLMLEKVLEADGITKEMIADQEKRMNLIQRLLAASQEGRIEIIQQEDESIDVEFFGILSRVVEASIVGQDESAAQSLNELQAALLEYSTQGRKLRLEAESVQGAMKSLQDLGDEITREKLLDLVVKAPNDTYLRALSRLARPGMDYTFFSMLSERIERARDKGRTRLVEIREKLLSYTQEVDAEYAQRAEVAKQNVEKVLQAQDIKATLEQNIEAVDEFFIQAVTKSLDEARRTGNLDHSARLQQVLDVINELSEPPEELTLIEDFLDLSDDEGKLQAAIESHREKMTPEFIQMLTVLISRTESSIEDFNGVEKEQQQGLLKQMQTIYNAVLAFSMRRSFKSQ